jgi:hypothetical protein
MFNVQSRSVSRRASMRVLLVVALGAGVVLGVAGPAAAEEPGEFSFGCAMPTSICEEAGRQATDAASAEAYLSQYQATPEPSLAAAGEPSLAATVDDGAVTEAGASRIGGFGYATSPAPGNRRFFSWRFSRNTAGRQLPFSRCQVLPSGQPVNCRFIGNIRFQAGFNLRNRFVSELNTVVNSDIPENLEVTSSYLCEGPSLECGTNTLGPSLLAARSQASFAFRAFQLTSTGSHDIVFQWRIFDPLTRTSAPTPSFDSINFGCTSYNPPNNPGDCFFGGSLRGDDA